MQYGLNAMFLMNRFSANIRENADEIEPELLTWFRIEQKFAKNLPKSPAAPPVSEIAAENGYCSGDPFGDSCKFQRRRSGGLAAFNRLVFKGLVRVVLRLFFPRFLRWTRYYPRCRRSRARSLRERGEAINPPPSYPS